MFLRAIKSFGIELIGILVNKKAGLQGFTTAWRPHPHIL
jgi:hypothetical protein